MALKTRKDVTIYISCVKGSLGALGGGEGRGERVRAESETRERKQKRNSFFLPSFLPRAPRVVLVP